MRSQERSARMRNRRAPQRRTAGYEVVRGQRRLAQEFPRGLWGLVGED
jgi:hypothetical protein